jgi:hypothetical protein
MLKYDTAKEGYVVPLTKAQLDNAPKYAQNDMPEFTSEYGRRVHSYYGVESYPDL